MLSFRTAPSPLQGGPSSRNSSRSQLLTESPQKQQQQLMKTSFQPADERNKSTSFSEPQSPLV
jgi:hypothetical protein